MGVAPPEMIRPIRSTMGGAGESSPALESPRGLGKTGVSSFPYRKGRRRNTCGNAQACEEIKVKAKPNTAKSQEEQASDEYNVEVAQCRHVCGLTVEDAICSINLAAPSL